MMETVNPRTIDGHSELPVAKSISSARLYGRASQSISAWAPVAKSASKAPTSLSARTIKKTLTVASAKFIAATTPIPAAEPTPRALR